MRNVTIFLLGFIIAVYALTRFYDLIITSVGSFIYNVGVAMPACNATDGLTKCHTGIIAGITLLFLAWVIAPILRRR
jgi:hypothetical protein